MLKQIQMRQSGEQTRALLNSTVMRSVAITLKDHPELAKNALHEDHLVSPITNESVPLMRDVGSDAADLDLAEYIARKRAQTMKQ